MSAVLAATPAACEGPDPAASSFALSPTASSAPAATGETSSGAKTTSTTTEPVHEDSSTSAADEPNTTGPLHDVGVTPDVGDLHPVGCKGKIDRNAVVMFSIAKPDCTPWDTCIGTSSTTASSTIGRRSTSLPIE